MCEEFCYMQIVLGLFRLLLSLHIYSFSSHGLILMLVLVPFTFLQNKNYFTDQN